MTLAATAAIFSLSPRHWTQRGQKAETTMIHVQRSNDGTRWLDASSHRTLSAAMSAADRLAANGISARITATARAIKPLVASGAVIATAHGEYVDAGQRWAITVSP